MASAVSSTRKSAAVPGGGAKRRLTASELHAAEREKVRLSIELHDGVGQHLTGIAFLAKALANRLQAREASETGDAEQIVALTNQAVSNIRALAHGLRPIGTEDNALSVALSQLTRDVGRVYGTDCRYQADAAVTVASPLVAHHLYRIAQEAVHNAIKHGSPGAILVDLANRAGNVVLTVLSPGTLQKPDATHPAETGGIGIASMRYRAQIIGARMSLAQVRGEEVRLKVTISSTAAQTLTEEGALP